MRQTDFAIGRARRRHERRKRLFRATLVLDAPDPMLLRARLRYRAAHRDVVRIHRRARHISATYFNVNILAKLSVSATFVFGNRTSLKLRV